MQSPVCVGMCMTPGSGSLWWQNSNMRDSMTSHYIAVFACRSRETQSMQRTCFLCCLPAMLWSLLTPVCHVTPAPKLFQFLKFTKALIKPKNSVIFKFCSLLHTLVSISLIILSKGMIQLGAFQSCPNLYYYQ